MEPFRVSPYLASLLDSYPDASLIAEAAKNGGHHSKSAIARLWLSEGIPFAFKATPALYEVLRTWLGGQLEVDPKEIHLSGSARLGQSLAPYKRGRVFGIHSDLDLFVVSQSLFNRVKTDFDKWSCQYEEGLVQPCNDREGGFWLENNQRGKATIQRGFIDSKLVPNRNNYRQIQTISQSMWLLKKKLDITQGAPSIKGASIRCYKDWDSYVRQVVISLS